MQQGCGCPATFFFKIAIANSLSSTGRQAQMKPQVNMTSRFFIAWIEKTFEVELPVLAHPLIYRFISAVF